MKKYNLAQRSAEDILKMNVDLTASSIAFKEKYNQFVNIAEISELQPAALQDYFMLRLEEYRKLSRQIGIIKFNPAEGANNQKSG